MTTAQANWQQTLSSLTNLSQAGGFAPVVDGVGRLAIVFVNLYVVDLEDGGWVLVDTGLPNTAWYVRRAIESRYGANARPRAIVLTHGHFDHAGNVIELAREWDVPVYAHPLEMPYLTGKSDYPPQDPTPGGAICFLSRFFPRTGVDLGSRVQALGEDGLIPPLPGWRFIHTPGHTAGHLSLIRESDRMVIAGDALATVDLDAWSSQLTWPRELSRPATPFTPDWVAARRSVEALADLSPSTVAAGHGLPISSDHLADELRAFAATMPQPPGGRYTDDPVRYAPDGSVAVVPPPVPDPLPRKLLIGGATALVALTALGAMRAGNRSKA